MDEPGDRDRILAGAVGPEAGVGDLGRRADARIEDDVDVRAREDGLDVGRDRRPEPHVEPARLAEVEALLGRRVDDPAPELQPRPRQARLDDDASGMSGRPHRRPDPVHPQLPARPEVWTGRLPPDPCHLPAWDAATLSRWLHDPTGDMTASTPSSSAPGRTAWPRRSRWPVPGARSASTRPRRDGRWRDADRGADAPRVPPRRLLDDPAADPRLAVLRTDRPRGARRRARSTPTRRSRTRSTAAGRPSSSGRWRRPRPGSAGRDGRAWRRLFGPLVRDADEARPGDPPAGRPRPAAPAGPRPVRPARAAVGARASPAAGSTTSRRGRCSPGSPPTRCSASIAR